ncbi:protein HGH1 homolog [Anabrus simplex]|uniref:protein HGH1 homolog n=1 Tax=Anabrus simplex TaxID=316456 RepID=UPI0035A392F5
MDELSDMMNFLSINARLDLKSVACQYILGLTGSEGGREVLLKRPVLVKCVVDLIRDPVVNVAKDAILSIVNFSADERGARMLLAEECCQKLGQDDTSNQRDDVVATCLSALLDPECPLADPACMVLSNVTRLASNVERFMYLVERSDFSLDQIITAFTKRIYNKKGANLHYLGPLFSNLSQSITVRTFLMDRERCVIQRLLPFTGFHQSVVRRGGIVGMIKNCTFDVENHSWLLSPEVDVLPHLLLPLAGPEEFPDDEVDNLPPELQYLPQDKRREPDPDIRKMLLETLLQLCALRESRELMRSRNVYLILRELHKWEEDRAVLLACENVIDILIRTEEEIGESNLRSIDVPEDLQNKFQKMDEDFVNT